MRFKHEIIMPVILKKDEKIEAVLDVLGEDYTVETFRAKFKELYAGDWLKIEKNYSSHLRKAKLGKPVPMPKPEQYVINALNVYIKKK